MVEKAGLGFCWIGIHNVLVRQIVLECVRYGKNEELIIKVSLFERVFLVIFTCLYIKADRYKPTCERMYLVLAEAVHNHDHNISLSLHLTSRLHLE